MSLTSFFKKKNRPALLGIDLSPSSVKIVELSEGKRCAFRLDRYAVETLEPGLIVDGEIERPEPLADALLRAVQRCHTKTRDVALAIPSAFVIVKKILLPDGLSEEGYEFQVENEASQYIPFPMEEVNVDFQILGPAPSEEGFVEVLLAASRKEKVDERVAVAEMAGLRPVALDVEMYAQRAGIDYLAKSLPSGGDGQVIAVFSVGATKTSLLVVLDRQTIFEYEQPFGGKWLTEEMSRVCGCSNTEAETWKRAGAAPKNYKEELVPAFIEQGAMSINRALQYFHSSTPYSSVDHVFLGGGSAVVEGLVPAVTESIQSSVILMDPFLGMEIGKGVDTKKLKANAPALVLASGLAMWGFSE